MGENLISESKFDRYWFDLLLLYFEYSILLTKTHTDAFIEFIIST